MAVTHTTPLATTRQTVTTDSAQARPDGARFEAPLHTLPYPVRDVRGAALETRDLIADGDDLLF